MRDIRGFFIGLKHCTVTIPVGNDNAFSLTSRLLLKTDTSHLWLTKIMAARRYGISSAQICDVFLGDLGCFLIAFAIHTCLPRNLDVG